MNEIMQRVEQDFAAVFAPAIKPGIDSAHKPVLAAFTGIAIERHTHVDASLGLECPWCGGSGAVEVPTGVNYNVGGFHSRNERCGLCDGARWFEPSQTFAEFMREWSAECGSSVREMFEENGVWFYQWEWLTQFLTGSQIEAIGDDGVAALMELSEPLEAT